MKCTLLMCKVRLSADTCLRRILCTLTKLTENHSSLYMCESKLDTTCKQDLHDATAASNAPVSAPLHHSIPQLAPNLFSSRKSSVAYEELVSSCGTMSTRKTVIRPVPYRDVTFRTLCIQDGMKGSQGCQQGEICPPCCMIRGGRARLTSNVHERVNAGNGANPPGTCTDNGTQHRSSAMAAICSIILIMESSCSLPPRLCHRYY